MGDMFPCQPQRHSAPSAVDGNALHLSLQSGLLCTVETVWRISPLFAFPRQSSTRECESIRRNATFNHFHQWMEGLGLGEGNPFCDLPPYSASQISIYADYKHINVAFRSSMALGDLGYTDGVLSVMTAEGLRRVLSWSAIATAAGLSALRADEGVYPTLWLGSRRSHSPLHYDTYGRNVVVQLSGRKRWLLWPPGANGLSPLRVPFEESSVYSDLDPMRYMETGGGLDSEFKRNFPEMVDITLEAGDVLLVPPQWWHFVITVIVKIESMLTFMLICCIFQESAESLSCNFWIPCKGDNEERVKEAAAKFLFGALMDTLGRCGVDTTGRYGGWSNPVDCNDDNTADDENLEHSSAKSGEIGEASYENIDLDTLLEAIRECGATSNDEGEDCSNYAEDVLKKLINAAITPEVTTKFLNSLKISGIIPE